MKLTDSDVEWLRSSFPNLVYDQNAQKIAGELDFFACFDSATNRMLIEGLERDDTIRNSDSVVCDVFEIEMRLDSESLCPNGWPRVYEVGGRYRSTAKKYNIYPIDLHFFEDGACCLGIKYSRERNLTLEHFLYNLVIPFFYRLSYVNRFGLETARNHLWGEYSHGDKGSKEHEREMIRIGQHNVGRNEPCPCGSGVKHKKCCLYEVQAVRSRRPQMNRRIRESHEKR